MKGKEKTQKRTKMNFSECYFPKIPIYDIAFINFLSDMGILAYTFISMDAWFNKSTIHCIWIEGNERKIWNWVSRLGLCKNETSTKTFHSTFSYEDLRRKADIESHVTFYMILFCL